MSPSRKGELWRVRTRVGIAVFLTLLLSPRAALGLLGGSLTGAIDLSAVQIDTDGDDQNSLRQDYSVNLSKKPLPNVGLRLGVHFQRFEQDAVQAPSAWTEKFQPSGQVIWNHPLFTMTGNGLRRTTKARNLEGGLETDNVGVAFQTKDSRYPLLNIRQDWIQSKDTSSERERDTKDRRFQASAIYGYDEMTMNYSFTHRNTDNIISALESVRDEHIFRWERAVTPLGSERLRAGASYTLNHSSQTDERSGSDPFLQRHFPRTGIYGEDTSPDFGELETTSGLTDGNTTNPVQPEIVIGDVQEFQNVGLDLGVSVPVAAIYVYTDRTSGSTVEWSVYGSDDNRSWQLWTSVPESSFNAAAGRYEILFESRSARYVKVVNQGLNEVSGVLVTEMEAYEQLDEVDRRRLEATAHLATAQANYLLSESVTTLADVTYQRRPGLTTIEGRSDISYGLGGRYEQSEQVTHVLRWQQSFQLFDGDRNDLTDHGASYALMVDPLPTLGFFFSTGTRVNGEDGDRIRELNSLVAEVRTSPLPTLHLSGEVEGARDNDFVGRSKHDVLTYRTSISGDLTEELAFAIAQAAQRTKSLPEDTLRTRDRYSASLEFRPTGALQAKGTVSLVQDRTDRFNQDYVLSWNIGPKASLSAQATLSDPGDGRTSARYTSSLQYKLSARTTIYLTASRTDFSQAGGGETTSFLQGFRTGF